MACGVFESLSFLFELVSSGCTGSSLTRAGFLWLGLLFPAAHRRGFACGTQTPRGTVGFGGRGAWAQQLWHSCSEAGGIFLAQGLSEPMSSALAGGLLSTTPLGKSSFFFNLKNFLVATLNNSMSLHYIFLGRGPLRHWGNIEESY